MLKCKKEAGETANGCGTVIFGLKFVLPRFISHDLYDCCFCHDIYYQRQIKKQAVDLELIYCIYDSASKDPWLKQTLKIWFAHFVVWILQTRLSQWCYKRSQKK
jgi:hypothetical protein